MLQYLLKEFSKKIYPIVNKNMNYYPPCGRDPCYCYRYLDLNDIQNKYFYDSCFRSRIHFENKKN